MKNRPLVGISARTAKFALKTRPRSAVVAAALCAASIAIAGPTEVLVEGSPYGSVGAIASIQAISISDGLTLTTSAKLPNGAMGLLTHAVGEVDWRTPFVSDEIGLSARGEIFEAAGSGSGNLTAFSAGIYNRPGVLGPTVPGIIDSAWTASNSQTLFTGSNSTRNARRGPAGPLFEFLVQPVKCPIVLHWDSDVAGNHKYQH